MGDFRHTGRKLREAHAAHRRRCDRKRALRSEAVRARRRVVGKALACAGILALLLACALVVGDSDYHATPIGWIPFLSAVLAIAGGFAYLQVIKAKLTFSESSDLRDCERDSDVRFTVRFNNASPLFIFRVEAFFYISDLYGNKASEASTTLALSPHESYDLGFSTKFEHIGTYTAGLDRIVVQDFLGLFETTVRNERRRQVNVTPKLQAIDDIRFSADAMQETTKAAKSHVADSMDYSHVREYVPGDPLKTIHWKLSARSDHYLTRLYEVYTNPGVAVVLDFFGPSDEAGELMAMFDCVVESGLSLSQHAREKGMDVDLLYVDKRGDAQSLSTWSKEDLPRLVDEMPRMRRDLALAQEAAGLLSDQISSRYGQNNLVICSANLDSEMVSLAVEAKLRRRSPLFIAVVPRKLTGRALDAYTKPLSRLDASDIPYIVLSNANDLRGVRA